MQPVHKTFQKEAEEPVVSVHISGLIDITESDERALSIPAQNIRTLRYRTDTNRNSFVLYPTSDSDYTLAIIHPVKTSPEILKRIYKAALAGQDFDLTQYSGPRGRILERYEDLPEVKVLLAQEAEARAKAALSKSGARPA